MQNFLLVIFTLCLMTLDGYFGHRQFLPSTDQSLETDVTDSATCLITIKNSSYECAKNLSSATANSLQSAIFFCERELASPSDSTTGTIVFDLTNINSAQVVGNDKYPNIFNMSELTNTSLIQGGRSKNVYSLTFANSLVKIVLNSASKREIITFANAVNAKIVKISFDIEDDVIRGQLAFNSSPAVLEVFPPINYSSGNEPRRPWSIIGRQNMPDIIECSSHRVLERLGNKYFFFANGNGGNNNSHDEIINCHVSQIHPSSNYTVNYPNATFFLVGILNATVLPRSVDYTKAYSIITVTEGSRAVIAFKNRPLYGHTLSIKYEPKRNILTWELLWKDEVVLFLLVQGYFRTITAREKIAMNISDDSALEKVAAVLIRDRFTSSILVPRIHLSSEEKTDIIEVTELLIDKKMKGNTLEEALDEYYLIKTTANPRFDIDVLITSNQTGNTFYFGKSSSDLIVFQSHSKFAMGLNASDVYVVTKNSPKFVWINNEAHDGAIDTVVMAPELCEHLTLADHRSDHLFIPRLKFDVVVICINNRIMMNTTVILMNYLKNDFYRHVTFFLNNMSYVIFPSQWVISDRGNNSHFEIFALAQFASMVNSQENTVIDLDSYHKYLVIHVADKKQPFNACVEDYYDVILTVSDTKPRVQVRLRHFFSLPVFLMPEISDEWSNKVLFIVDNLFSDEIPEKLDAVTIKNLAVPFDDY